MTTMTSYVEEPMAYSFGGLQAQSPLKHGQDAYFTHDYIVPPNDQLLPVDETPFYHMNHGIAYMEHRTPQWQHVGPILPWHAPYQEIGPHRTYTLDSTDVSSADTVSARPSEEPRFEPAYHKYHAPSPPYSSSQIYASPSPTHASLGTGCVGVTPQDVQHQPDAAMEPTDHFDMGDTVELQPDQGAAYGASPGMMETGLPTPTSETVPGSAGADNAQPMGEETEGDDTSVDNSGTYSPVSRKSKSKKGKPSPKASGPKSPLKSRQSKHKVTKSASRTNGASSLISPTPSARELSATTCKTCGQEQANKNALAHHVQAVHQRVFTCIFDIYGCTSTFGAKNEWKRHCSTQHLRPSFYRCDMGACVPQNAMTSRQHPDWDTPVASPSVPGFNDFNRKDLFIQHQRRMHAPENINSATQAEKDRFKQQCEKAALRCLVSARKPPPRTICGFCQAKGSPVVFEGSSAWETRMEHVGRHLEAAKGESLQWDEDVDLRNWLLQEGLLKGTERGQWRLTNLIKTEESKSGRR